MDLQSLPARRGCERGARLAHGGSSGAALEGLIVPSKFYSSSIAAGRPVIFIGDADGEIARAVSRGTCGVTVSPEDAVAMAAAVERLCDDADACARMGANARAMFESEFTQAIAIEKWRAVLRDAQL